MSAEFMDLLAARFVDEPAKDVLVQVLQKLPVSVM